MKFSILEGDESVRLHEVRDELENLCPSLNNDWEGVLEMEPRTPYGSRTPEITLKLYDTSDAGAQLANDGKPEEMSDSGWSMAFGDRPPEFIAGWLAAELWKYWSDNG